MEIVEDIPIERNVLLRRTRGEPRLRCRMSYDFAAATVLEKERKTVLKYNLTADIRVQSWYTSLRQFRASKQAGLSISGINKEETVHHEI
jgi:hypothetical protein